MTEAADRPVGAEEGSPATGVLTFLIADVRGYTAYTAQHGDEAAARLASRFADLTEGVVTARDGKLLELRGDEALAIFSSARQSVRAAVELQERLAALRRSESALPIHVGIGLDVGEAIPVRDGFRGAALNVAARLCGLAGPDDVFATETLVHLTQQLDGLTYRERGPALLKGMPAPVQVIQIAREGTLPDELPPLQPPPSAPHQNLPASPTPMVGRQSEIDAVLGLLHRPSVRLVTLTGTGGTGKTRLAVEVADALVGHFEDGVCFVSLAAIRDSDLVPTTIAHSLGLIEESGTSVDDTLREYLRNRRLLLLLDNFEQVRGAAPFLSELLATCSRIKVLVTSRAVLNEYGEYVYEVPPLGLPDLQLLPDLAQLAQIESVAMFVERAQAAKASFALTPQNAGVVAEICRRLDGLPLAIELAAARIRVLPPAALSTRLERRLAVLTGGARGLPERQQTLRATVDWSYGLLDQPEQILFARLAIFAGGCTLEAAETVTDLHGDLSLDLLDSVAVLIENSLVRQEGEDEARYVMLETVREYARDQLESSGEAEALARAHSDYYISMAGEADPGLRGPEQGLWLTRLDAEHDNLRAALAWAIRRGEVGMGLRLAGSIWRYWWARGYLSEGRQWLESLLSLDGGDSAVRARALSGLANIAWSQGDLERAEVLHREALELRRTLGDLAGVALSLNNIGIVKEVRGNFDEAVQLYEEALVSARESSDRWAIALILGNLCGILARDKVAWKRSRQLGQESLALWRELGDRASQGRVLNNLAGLALDQQDFRRAARLQRQSLELYRELGQDENVAFCIEGAARIMTELGQDAEATQLWGAADSLRRTRGQPLGPAEQADRERHLDIVRARLDTGTFGAAWTAGEATDMKEMEEYALRALSLIEEDQRPHD